MKRSECLLWELLLCPRWGIQVMRVCGILPGTVQVDRRGDVVESWSRWGVIFSSLSISLGVGLTVVSLGVSGAPSFSNSSKTSSSLETANLVLATVFPVSAITAFLVMKSRWCSFLEHLLQADRSLSLWTGPEGGYRTSNLEISLLTFTTFASNGCMLYSAVQNQMALDCSPVVWVTILWHNILTEAIQALMVVVLHALALRFRRLNTAVQNHCHLQNGKHHLMSSDDQHEYRNDETVHHLADIRPSKIVSDVRHLAKIHESLIEASCVIGSFLSLLSPLYVLIIFLGSIMLCFILVSYIIGDHNQLPVAFGTSVAVFCFMRTAEFAAVLYYCQMPCSEASKTALYVHKLYNQRDSIILKSELLLFSNQLAKSNFTFSACGMFQMNISLIYSIVSAISTYLVILVQFQFM